MNLPSLVLGYDNGLSPGQCQAIISTNNEILFIWSLGKNFSAIVIELQPFSIKKMHIKMSSAKWRPFCLGLNVLTRCLLLCHRSCSACHLFGIQPLLTHWPLGNFNKIKKNKFQLISVTDGCDISSDIALRWTSLDLSDDKSTLVQVMAWCHQATSRYRRQCWPRSISPNGVTRPQWVKPKTLIESLRTFQFSKFLIKKFRILCWTKYIRKWCL